MMQPPSYGREGGEISFTIPRKITDIFEQEPRIVFKPLPGIILLDLNKVRQVEMLQKLANDKEFANQFDVVLIPKA